MSYRIKPFLRLSLLLVLIFLVVSLVGCGSNSKPTPPPPPAVTISVTPNPSSVTYGSTLTFTATVSNTTNTAVTWSVDEGASGGTINSAGVYTPPNAEGTFHVTATSQADSTKKSTAPVTVTIPTTVTVTPGTASLAINGQQAFTVAVTHVTDSSVMWSVQESGGGVIDSNGNYTAPNLAGTYHVVATSVEHMMKSGTAEVTVSAPSPTITSGPPVAAAEAELYTYAPTATDPAGGTVEFAIVSGPTGATVESGQLTWTPAREQSRVENSFTIRAITSEGGTVDQSWTVTPTGIIRGMMIAKHLDASGVTDVPVDLSAFTLLAHTPDANGVLTDLAGTGATDGTFEIPHVPAGNYWLDVQAPAVAMDSPSYDICGTGQILTNRSDIDLSCYVQGRGNLQVASAGTMRHFQLQGLTPWNAADGFEFDIPGAREWDYWGGLPADSVAYDGLRGAYYLATGDAGWLGQWNNAMSTGDRPYTALTKVLNFTSVEDADGGTVTLAGTMQGVAGSNSFDAAIAGTQFKALNSAINPNATTAESELYIETHPFGLTHGYVQYGPGMFYFSASSSDATNQPIETDVDLGQFTYGNPFPSTWPLITEYWHSANVDYSSGGGSMLFSSYYQITSALPTLNKPIVPILGPVTGATVDGADFFTGQQVSATPTIAWSAPTTGTAQGYIVRVLSLEAGNNYVEYEFRTTDTSITIPAGVLLPAVNYVFAIEVLNETGQDLAATPFMTGFPRAGVWTVSDVFTVGALNLPASRTGMVVRHSPFPSMHNVVKTLGSSRRLTQKQAQ